MLHADLLSATRLAEVVTNVWAERDAAAPPAAFPDLPTSWPQRYERMATRRHGVRATLLVRGTNLPTAAWTFRFKAR